MSMLRITVGAAMDRSFEQTLNTLVAATQKAQRRIGTEEARANRSKRADAAAAAREAERAADRAAAKAAKADKRAAAEKKKAAKDASAEAKREADKAAAAAEKAADRAIAASNRQKMAQVRNIRTWTNEGIAAINMQTRHMEAQARQAAALARRHRQSQAPVARLARGTGQLGGSMQSMAALGVVAWGASQAMGAVGGIARGMGAETSLQSIMQQNNTHEALAAKIANSGFRPDDPANSRLVGTRELMEEQFSVGKKHGFSGEEVAQATDQIQKLTGDLAQARGVTERIAFYARATGTDLREAGELFGKTMAAYDPKLDKGVRAQMAQDMMMAYAGQGKQGSVEIEDAAKIGGRLAGLAVRSGGDIVRGQKESMAMLQMVNPLKGGDPRAGTTAVEAWYGQFGKDARIKGFKAFGLTEEEKAKNKKLGKSGQGVEGVRIRDDAGNLRSQKDIVMDLLRRSGGDKAQLNTVIKDKNAQIFMSSVLRTFDQTKGTLEEKIAAVGASFDELTNATLGEKEAIAMHANAMQTAEAKAASFNTEMARIVSELQTNLAPAFEALAPILLELAQGLTDLIGEITRGKQTLLAKDQETASAKGFTSAHELREAMRTGKLTKVQLDAAKKEYDKQKQEADALRAKTEEQNKPGTLEKVAGYAKYAAAVPLVGTLAGGVAAAAEYGLGRMRDADHEQALRGNEDVARGVTAFGDALTEAEKRVIIVEDQTKDAPIPKQSPLGGRQAIAAGC